MQIIRQRNAQPDCWPDVWAWAPELAPEEAFAALEDILLGSSITQLLLPVEIWERFSQEITSAMAQRTQSGNPLQIGVSADTDFNPDKLGDRVSHLTLIRICFEAFNDGRGYSHAVALRGQHGYMGELRAANVVKENLAMLERCGYDSFELTPGSDVDEALAQIDALAMSA